LFFDTVPTALYQLGTRLEWVRSHAAIRGLAQALGAAEADALLAHVRLRTALLNALVALDQGGKHLKAAERYLVRGRPAPQGVTPRGREEALYETHGRAVDAASGARGRQR